MVAYNVEPMYTDRIIGTVFQPVLYDQWLTDIMVE